MCIFAFSPQIVNHSTFTLGVYPHVVYSELNAVPFIERFSKNFDDDTTTNTSHLVPSGYSWPHE